MRVALFAFYCVLDAANGILGGASDFVSLAFGGEFGIAHGFANGNLDFAFQHFCRTSNAIFVHDISRFETRQPQNCEPVTA